MSKRWNRNKGPRRAYLKRFHSEVVNAGRSVNTLVLGEYQSRAATLVTPPNKANYSDNEEYYRTRRVLELKPIDVVLGKLRHLWTNNFWQGYDIFNRICLINTERRKLFLFFSGPRWFFVQECYELREIAKGSNVLREHWYVLRSIIYPDKDTAMKKYYNANICWVENNHIEQPLAAGTLGPKLHLENFVRKSSD